MYTRVRLHCSGGACPLLLAKKPATVVFEYLYLLTENKDNYLRYTVLKSLF